MSELKLRHPKKRAVSSARRAVLIFLRLFDGLFRWNEPIPAALLSHGAKDKRSVARDQRQEGAQEIRGIARQGFLGLAAPYVFKHLGKAWIAGAQSRDPRVVVPNQVRYCRPVCVGGIADLHQGMRGMFFRGVDLRETRTKDARLPIFTAGGDHLLFDMVFREPNLRAVVLGGIADDDELVNRGVGGEIEFVVKLGDERAE